MIQSPGFYQLVGGPQSGKTTLASLLARKHRAKVWITTESEFSPAIWQAIGWKPQVVLRAERVAEAFEMIKEVQGVSPMVVLDSLAALRPTSEHTNRIAYEVTCKLFVPKVKVLVINQDRKPYPPGGKRWHRLARTYRLLNYRLQPALYSKLVGTGQWLVWWKGKQPQLRGLEERDRVWLPE